MYRHATSVDNALQLAFVHLAKVMGMNKTHRIANYFLSGKDNIEVREVQSEEKDLDK